MPNAKGKYELDEISSDKNTFEARVSVNGDFFKFLKDLDLDGHHKDMCIGDIIQEYAQEKADKLNNDDLIKEFGNERPSGMFESYEQDMRYSAQQSYIDEVYKDFRGKSGIQNIVGYIAFKKAYDRQDGELDRPNMPIAGAKYEKIHDFVEKADERLTIAQIQKFVVKTITQPLKKTKQKSNKEMTMGM